MENFPLLTSGRLILRAMRPEDIDSLVAHCNNEKISDQILNIPYPYNIEDAVFRMNFVFQGFKSKDRFVFAITFKGEDKLIGEIGLHLDKINNGAQFGYWIAEPYWGKGIATEALAELLRFGFEQLNLNKIFATHYPNNTGSAKVMLNNKMIKEAELKEHYKVGDAYRDVIQYRLTRAEYQEKI